MSTRGEDVERQNSGPSRATMLAMNDVTTPLAVPADPAARIRAFLEHESVVWLATAGTGGRPSLVPVWFLWDGGAILVASKPGARKVRNIRSNSEVMLALGDADEDFDVGLVEAKAELVDIPTRALLSAGLHAKYGRRMAAIGLSPEEFATTYSQVVRIDPSNWLHWHGRTPRSTGRSVATRLIGRFGRLYRALGPSRTRVLTPAHA